MSDNSMVVLQVVYLTLQGHDAEEIAEELELPLVEVNTYRRVLRQVQAKKDKSGDCPDYNPNQEECEQCLTRAEEPCPFV